MVEREYLCSFVPLYLCTFVPSYHGLPGGHDTPRGDHFTDRDPPDLLGLRRRDGEYCNTVRFSKDLLHRGCMVTDT
jgi:hypothetical protein